MVARHCHWRNFHRRGKGRDRRSADDPVAQLRCVKPPEAAAPTPHRSTTEFGTHRLPSNSKSRGRVASDSRDTAATARGRRQRAVAAVGNRAPDALVREQAGLARRSSRLLSPRRPRCCGVAATSSCHCPVPSQTIKIIVIGRCERYSFATGAADAERWR